MPVSSLEEVDEVDPKGLFGLAYLPVLTALALQLFTESADLVGQRLVRGGARQELAHPAHAAVGSSSLVHQLSFQKELAELL